jgi:hypothetical protein
MHDGKPTGRRQGGQPAQQAAEARGDEIDHDAESANFLRAFEAKDKQALWQAIIYCAMNRIPMWDWLRDGLYLIDNAAEAGEIKSWDHVFGKPWGKGQRHGLTVGASASKCGGPFTMRSARRTSLTMSCLIGLPRNSNLSAAKSGSFIPT